MLLLLACSNTSFVSAADTAGGGSTSGATGACASDATKELLADHATAVLSVAETIDRPPDPARVATFFEVPGYSAGPWFFLTLDAACPDATVEPVCTGEVCYSPRCEGEAWVSDAAPAAEALGAWTRAEVTQTVRWLTDGTGYRVDLEVADLEGPLVRLQGASALELGDEVDWAAAYDVTLDGGYQEEVTMRFYRGKGTLEVWGSQVATWNGEGFDDENCFGEP